jgi:polyisoprenoid-binding protein YceI
MKKLIVLLFLPCSLLAQKFTVDQSKVTFFSDATLEDIYAENTKTTSLYNLTTQEIVFSIPVKEFAFDRSLMREHFNEKYLESEKYPKSVFQGKIERFDPALTGPQEVVAKGKLTIHGVTKDIEVPGTIEKAGDQLSMKAKFNVKLEDYNVERPQLLWQKIAEEVEVAVELQYKPVK